MAKSKSRSKTRPAGLAQPDPSAVEAPPAGGVVGEVSSAEGDGPGAETTEAPPDQPAKATRQKAEYDPSKPAGPRNKMDYPIPEGGIAGVPEDYDGTKCKFPSRKDFQDEADFLDLRANVREVQVIADRKQAETIRKLGPVKNRAVAAKLAKLRSQSDILIAQLKAEGVDVDSALAAMGASSEGS